MNTNGISGDALTLAANRVRRLRHLANLSWIPIVCFVVLGTLAVLLPALRPILYSHNSELLFVVVAILFVPSSLTQLAFRLGMIRCPRCGLAFEAFNSVHVFSYCRRCMFCVTKPRS